MAGLHLSPISHPGPLATSLAKSQTRVKISCSLMGHAVMRKFNLNKHQEKRDCLPDCIKLLLCARVPPYLIVCKEN